MSDIPSPRPSPPPAKRGPGRPPKATVKPRVQDLAAFQEYCVDHQDFVDANSQPSPTPDELHRTMAGEEVELEPSGIPIEGSATAAEAINRAMLGEAVLPPEPPPALPKR